MAPRMENPVDLGQGAWERLDLDWQIRGSLNPRIAQLEDRNGLWLSPMEKELGSGYRFPGFIQDVKLGRVCPD